MDYKYYPYFLTARKILLAFTFLLPYYINIDSKAELSFLTPLTTVNLALTRLTRA